MYEALPVYTSTDRTVEPVDLSLVDRSLLSPGEVDFYLQNLAVPYRYDDDGLVIAVASDDAGGRASFDAFFEEPVRLVLADRRELLAYVDSQFRTLLSDDAVLALAKAEPQLSARQTITRAQSATLLTIGSVLVFGLVFRTYDAVLGLVLALAAGFVANVFFRGLLVWVGAGEENEEKTTFQCISDESLPLYTILVPLYREANVLPALMQALAALDYPRDKLDIKLVIEEDDEETNRAANTLTGTAPSEIIRVPFSLPRTKPKACNYALRFARGEFVVIFDAEDRPEPDQLRKAVSVFRNASPELGCLQASLNFFNAAENWLTRLFSLDYSLWFDFLLPGLDRLRVPLPLGGTSNHFRTEVLRAIHGWDAFNVTEDADLGIRLARKGFRASVLDSTTYEEATNRLPNWLRQRSRWVKGYMQTSSPVI